MPVAWFICGFNRTPGKMPARECAMNSFTPLIRADAGDWGESEVLGGYALVKVRASDATLATIAGTAGFFRIPLASLDVQLSSLSGQQRNAIRDRILAMGYTDAEILAALGNNLGLRTLGQVLRFAASRRRKPRYDVIQDSIVLDGDVQSCRLIEDIDLEITE